MKIQQLLDHHGIQTNPFADEDAQTDLVFKGFCIKHTYHPAWDKIYGNPEEPATAIVFGEKGSGKTALRLQIVRHLADYNADHPETRSLVIEYADFNPFLDQFRERFRGRRRKIERVLGQWRIWDHIDALLSLGVTQLVDRILEDRQASHAAACDAQPLPIQSLNHAQARDLLLLAACYDRSTAGESDERWKRLRRKLRFSIWRTKWVLALPMVVAGAMAGLMGWLGHWEWLKTIWPYLVLGASFLPWFWRCLKASHQAWGVTRHTRVLHKNWRHLKRVFMKFSDRQLSGQPLPRAQRTDDRYELLDKLQNILRTLKLTGMVVLIDRVDEPYLINGSSELMRALIWPMLDNKLLKHPGIGFKALLPSELLDFIDRETADFHQRARLDKQNLVRSLQWTGESLLDLANGRLEACAAEGRTPKLRDLLDESISDARLLDAMRSLRVPRHLFKFLYQAMVAHTNAHTDTEPAWKISSAVFESTLALYQRDQSAFERGMGTV
jgi:hypothetical protein